MNAGLTILAGATGHLGGLVAAELRARGAPVRAIVRPDTSGDDRARLRAMGIDVAESAYTDPRRLRGACEGGSCVVSTLSGLREVIVDAQTALLEAAVGAGAPRFIPSDFAINFYLMPDGYNRNLDLRREFALRLERAPIAATSILNGMFASLLNGDAPFILFPLRRVLYWGNADQPMDFTTIENTAEFTAAAALDADTPRFLRIAGDVMSARDLAAAAGRLTGHPFKLLRGGGLRRLEKLIAFTRFVARGGEQVYPPWQGMQYMHNMYDGRVKLDPLDNGRYPDIRWTTVDDVLERHLRQRRLEERESERPAT